MEKRDNASPPAAEEVTTLVDEPSADLPKGLAELGVSTATSVDPLKAPLKLPALGVGRIFTLGEDGNIELTIGGRIVPASVDPTVHRSVLKTADTNGESVLVEERDGQIWVVGALRTQPTPGVDKMSTINLEADHINMKAKEDITMSSGVAAIAVRAIGEVETYAERIMSRAESVHKIIGRMLRLN